MKLEIKGKKSAGEETKEILGRWDLREGFQVLMSPSRKFMFLLFLITLSWDIFWIKSKYKDQIRTQNLNTKVDSGPIS